MARFEKGNAGKAKGTKNLAQFKISYWLDKLADEWPHLTPNQRSHYSVELTKILINKSKALPLDPIDSKLNADAAISLLKEIEAKENVPTDVKKV